MKLLEGHLVLYFDFKDVLKILFLLNYNKIGMFLYSL